MTQEPSYGIGKTRLDSGCLPCILQKVVDAIPEETPEEKRLSFLQEIFALMGRAHPATSAPEIARDVQHLQDAAFGAQVNYAEVKSFFNQKLMQHASFIREEIRRAADPLRRAVQFSMCGNYIDLGTPGAVTEEELERILQESDSIAIAETTWDALQQDLAQAKRLVFLLDNCGEIVLDKLLMEELLRQYPDLTITAFVRGAENLNDVTIEDAEEVRLTDVVSVLPNGSDIAGTCIDKISEEAREKLLAADLIFSKGQGNFETLHGCGLSIYYFFLCKCALFAKRFHQPQYTGMVLSEEEASQVV